MTDLVVLHCPSCEMGFHSRRLLDKHMEKFCIGGETTTTYRNGHASHKGKEPKKTETPNKTLHAWKSKRHPFRHLEDEELKQQEHHCRSFDHTGNVPESPALKKLTEEFHKLRMSLEDTLPSFRTSQKEDGNSHQILHQKEYWQRQQQMKEAHEHQLADIQTRNQHLQQQKDEIHKRLSELKLENPATSHIEQLLMELNIQEGKNKLALDALQEQVGLLQIAAESRSNPEPPTKIKTEATEEKVQKKVAFKFMPFPAAVGPLSSEIQTLYLAYLQGGGSDHNILHQMYELQTEAIALEKGGARPKHRGTKKTHEGSPSTYPRGLDAELLSIELENQRLEDEIFKLKMLKERRKMEGGPSDTELTKLQQTHMAEVAHLHAEIGRLRNNTEALKPHWPRKGPPPILPPPVAPPLPPPPPHHPHGLADPAFLVSNMDSVGSSAPAANQYFLDPSETLGPAPYDPASGFVIFYDFLLGLDPKFHHVCLVSSLYRNGQELGKRTPLPVVSSDMGQFSQSMMDGQKGCCAILATRQPVPRVLPSASITLVTELQASGGFDAYGLEIQNLVPRGWAKINIFDHLHQVMSGHWKIPIRVLPVKPNFTAEQLNGVPQAGKAELYLRLVNARDADMQSMAEIYPGSALLYKYPPTVSRHTASPADFPPAQRSFHPAPTNLSFSVSPYTGFVDPPPNQEQPLQHKSHERKGETQPQAGHAKPQQESLLGFILDRVKGAPPGDGAIRLTGYHQKTGQVIGTRDSGLNYCTDAVRSNIKHGYFVFGEQEVTFWDVTVQEDMILVARFYHWPSGRTATAPWDKVLPQPQYQPLLESEKWLAAWTVVKLTKLSESAKVMFAGATKEELGMPVWNTGTHTLTLYHGPVPSVAALSTLILQSAEQKHQDYKLYGDATLRLHIFITQKPELPFLPESSPTLDPVKPCPHDAFLHRVRETPPMDSFGTGDGFDLYIDGARFLPDDVTVTRVTARIFTSGFQQIGPDIYTRIDLNSSIYDPVYNYSIQIREPVITPCATLLLKVYSIDHLSSSLIQIGWAALNLFVESGTYTVPEPGAKGIRVSLNDGAHQLRIFHNGPCLDQPFSTTTLTSTGRYVPCATLLVRLVKAPVDASHRTLQRDMVPQTDWVKLGLFQPRPEYSDGVYYSDSAKPTIGENCFYEAMANRSVVSVREIVHQLTGHSKNLSTDDEISAWIHHKLTRVPGSSPQPFNLTYVSRYIPTYGIKFAVDRAVNLPWADLTIAHFCFNPPGAFYFGSQWLKYDYPTFVEQLDTNSYQRCPAWLDGFKACPHRVYNEYSTIIIHLYEIAVNSARDALGEEDNLQTAQRKAMLKGEQLGYTLENQAWTALHVFSRGYCNTGIYQLPLYKGAPSQSVLTSLTQAKCSSVMKNMLHKKVIQLVSGASVIVCIADGRWSEKFRYSLLDIDQSYLPKKALDLYNKESLGVKIAELMLPATLQKQTRLVALEQL